jgi:hypothetical protein
MGDMEPPVRVDYVFRMGEVFPSDDPTGRYVARLSMALADLRLVADQMMRDDLTDRERVYFGRLMMAHMREVLLVLEPPEREPEAIRVGDVIAGMGTHEPGAPALLRHLWDTARAQLKAPLVLRRETTLWRELRRVRNRLLHYGYTAEGDRALATALDTVAHEEGVYRITTQGWMEADFADLVSVNLAFPMSVGTRELAPEDRQAREKAEAEELLRGVLESMGPLSTLLHRMEAVYFRTKPDDVLVRYDDGETETLREATARHSP